MEQKSYTFFSQQPLEQTQAEFNKKYDYPESKPKRKRRRKKHFANYVVFISLTAVAIYTTTAFILQFSGQGEVSPTLTTCFYSFFGVELASLALIKHSKNKYTGGANYGNTGTAAGVFTADNSLSASRYEEN